MTSPVVAMLVLGSALALLTLARPIDHDESQYVATAVLARNLIPYRDVAYLQTPLQPLVLAPVAAAAGTLAYPVLRLINALFGLVTILGVAIAARAAGASARSAMIAAMTMATCDIFLFSAAVARNDALPAMLFTVALVGMVRGAQDGNDRIGAMLIGFLLCASAAAKISYAIPALAYGGWALWHRQARPLWVAIGTLPIALMTAMLMASAPPAFWFQVITFPSVAPAEWYRATCQAFKMTGGAKLIDTAKFLALGPALPAMMIAVAAWRRRGTPTDRLLDLMIVAGLIAGLLPSPTWRQYLLPLLPPLFIRLALVWNSAPPSRPIRAAMAVFAVAGLAPSIAALAMASRTGLPMIVAQRDGAAVRRVLDALDITRPIATLSPQFVPATGRAIGTAFAPGPFYFRSSGLLDSADEARNHLVSWRDYVLDPASTGAILIGGERGERGGAARLDAALEHQAAELGWRRVPVAGTPFTLYVPNAMPVPISNPSAVRIR